MGTLVLAKKKRHSGSISSSSVVDIDSDKQLVAKFKAGDLDAFKQLYERYHKRLISVAIGVLNNPEDAEDIVVSGSDISVDINETLSLLDHMINGFPGSVISIERSVATTIFDLFHYQTPEKEDCSMVTESSQDYDC